MEFNIWKTVQDCFGSTAYREIGELLTEDDQKTQEGIRQAVPVVLDCLYTSAQTEDGLKCLEEELKRQQPGLLFQIRSRLLEEGQADYLAAAFALLEKFRGVDLSKLAAGLSRKSGLSTSASRQLLGIMTPIVCSAISQHQRVEKPDGPELRDKIGEHLSHLNRKKSAVDPVTLSSSELVDLIVAAHKEFGPYDRISEATLMNRLDISNSAAEQLQRELRWMGRIDPRNGFLNAAPALADVLVGRVYREVGPGKKLTTPLLVSALGISTHRADKLIEDMRRRGILSTAGALAGAYRALAKPEGIESVNEYHKYVLQHQSS